MLKTRYLALLGSVCFGYAISSPWLYASAESGLPEDLAIDLITDLSDKLAVKIADSDCGEFNEILDGAQSDAAKGGSSSSIIMQVLEDVKSNPTLRTIAITKLGDPLLKQTLNCDVVPVGALGEEKASIQDVEQLSNALATVISTSDCPAFNQILDDAQANQDGSEEDESLQTIQQLLTDAKTNSAAQSIMIANLGDPLLNRVLDCNLIPLSALR
ncbi:MAG: hypothetical protein AAGB01_05245 [Cyanobacteria bacterium P01_F01_bin.42]